jgi:hypothetical protein
MRRWHQDRKIALREWKKHHRSHVEQNKYDNRKLGRDPYEIDCVCDEQIGRFRKKDAFDCGHSQCVTCHSDKFPKREKHDQELLSELSFKEQLREM